MFIFVILNCDFSFNVDDLVREIVNDRGIVTANHHVSSSDAVDTDVFAGLSKSKHNENCTMKKLTLHLQLPVSDA